MKKYIFTGWLLAVVLGLLLAQLFFTGESTSEVAGNLTFALLIFCFPASLLAYPLASGAVLLFEHQGLFPYNSRLVLTLWWGLFAICGLIQWAVIFGCSRWRAGQSETRP